MFVSSLQIRLAGTRKLGKETTSEKLKGLQNKIFGSRFKRKIAAPASKSVNRQNSKGSRIQKGRLELTLDQN